MKASAGFVEPVHGVVRRWIGGAFFISPTSSRAKQTLLRPHHDESSVPLTHTGRSIATTRSFGSLPPSPPLSLLGSTHGRCLSGSGTVISPEERIRSAAARVRLQSKRGDDVNVNVDVAPVDVPPVDLGDLHDLNADIAGFVGALGDPDFDAQDDTPTSPATDRCHGHHRSYRTDHQDASVDEYSARRHLYHQQQQQQQPRTTEGDVNDHTDPTENVFNPLPTSNIRPQPRRLTFADHPTSPASAGTIEANAEEISVESQAGLRDPSWFEEIQAITGDDSTESQAEQRDSSTLIEGVRAHSAASGKQSPHTRQGKGTSHAPLSGAATAVYHADNSEVASRGHAANLKRRRRLGGRKTVLVLNGAACFVGGRLASTGEPQGCITRSMEEAASEFNISLTMCTSNRAHELLDHLCAGKYDAVIYNPAGFGAEVVSSDAYCMNPSSSSDPAHSRVDTRQPSLNEPVRGRGSALDGRSALEYGLIRAGCPIVSLSPRDIHLEGVLDGSSSGRPLNQAAGYIAGFSGAVSYRLAIAAVADMFESQGE